jgi:DNA polymerase-3 subunit epsilon
MTRGQESLVIDMLGDSHAGSDARAPRVALDSLDLVVLAASDDELAAHQAVLDGLDKAIKGTSVWRLEPAPTADEQTA